MSTSRIVFDIETSGLYEEVTKVWCISYVDLEDPDKEIYTDSYKSLKRALAVFSEASELIGHNIIDYDLPVLEKLFGWRPSEHTKITDTLVMSRLLNPDRPKPAGYTGKGGPHSLEAWGFALGRDKVYNEVWDVFDTVILRRCETDVDITSCLYHTLSSEIARCPQWEEALLLEHKIADIIARQERYGVLFDRELGLELVSKLDDLISTCDDELRNKAPVRVVCPYSTFIKEPFKIDGSLRKAVVDWCQKEHLTESYVAGPFTRISFEKINLGSQEQVKNWLTSIGWKPTEWNEKDGEATSPKLTEDSFESLPDGIGEALKNRTMYSHRRNQIQGWIDNVREDGRIGAGANPCGTPTGRMRHRTVVNVPAARAFLGHECRALFKVKPGYMMVGYDADALELRGLGHYMDDTQFTEAILNGRKEDGTDIHTVNQRAANITTRDNAKTFIYAFIYGAGDEKLGAVVGGSKTDGAELRKAFLKSYPKLDKLISEVKRAAKKGWIRGIDGRKIWLRTDTFGKVKDHSALNALIQSTGAILMKEVAVFLDRLVLEANLDASKIIDMHDEAQWEVLEKDVESFKELVFEAVSKVNSKYNLKCPLKTNVDVGLNWSETH